MTALSLSALVGELSREGSRSAYLFLSDTVYQAAQMYHAVKDEIIERGITFRMIDVGLPHRPDPLSLQIPIPPKILLLENTGFVTIDRYPQLNDYVKSVADHAPGPILWYASIETIGKLSEGYGSRATGAFVTITEIKND